MQREPDVLFIKDEHPNRSKGKLCEGSGLLEDSGNWSREQELETMRMGYAGEIPDHWIVNPERGTVTILTLWGAP